MGGRRPARASRTRRCSELAAVNGHWRARVGEHDVDAGTVVLAAGGRCYAEAEERGELSTNHPNATGEVTKLALGLGAEARDLDALQYHPNGGAWPPNMQGYSIPETTRAYGAVLLNAEGEEFTDSLGPRDAVSQAIFDEVEKGSGVDDARRPPGRLPRHDAHLARPTPRSRCRTCCAATAARASTRSREKILTYPVLHYQNGGLVIDTRRRDDARGRLRVRRDRRRHARTQSHDGQLACSSASSSDAARARPPPRKRSA